LDLLDETLGQKLGDDLAGGTAGQIRWPFKGTVVALRCRRQQHQLGVGQFHGILHSVATANGAATTEALQWPEGRRGRIPKGLFALGTVTVPLRLRWKASPLWIILLLVSGQTDHGPIRVKPNVKVPDGGGSETGSNSTHRSSNPLCPASHSGLSPAVSSARRSVDIPEG
jgi:hypothetical protein